MNILNGTWWTLLISLMSWAFVLYWTYKSGWLLGTMRKRTITVWLHTIISGALAGLWLWIIYIAHTGVINS